MTNQTLMNGFMNLFLYLASGAFPSEKETMTSTSSSYISSRLWDWQEMLPHSHKLLKSTASHNLSTHKPQHFVWESSPSACFPIPSEEYWALFLILTWLHKPEGFFFYNSPTYLCFILQHLKKNSVSHSKLKQPCTEIESHDLGCPC